MGVLEASRLHCTLPHEKALRRRVLQDEKLKRMSGIWMLRGTRWNRGAAVVAVEAGRSGRPSSLSWGEVVAEEDNKYQVYKSVFLR